MNSPLTKEMMHESGYDAGEFPEWIEKEDVLSALQGLKKEMDGFKNKTHDDDEWAFVDACVSLIDKWFPVFYSPGSFGGCEVLARAVQVQKPNGLNSNSPSVEEKRRLELGKNVAGDREKNCDSRKDGNSISVYTNKKEIEWFLEMQSEGRTRDLRVTTFMDSKEDIELSLSQPINGNTRASTDAGGHRVDDTGELSMLPKTEKKREEDVKDAPAKGCYKCTCTLGELKDGNKCRCNKKGEQK